MTPLEKAARAVVERWDKPLWKDTPETAEYITALREALEKLETPNLQCKSVQKRLAAQWGYVPAQAAEPVAWLHPANPTCVTANPTAYARGIPLYTAPQPARQPLIADEICDAWEFVTGHQIQFGPSNEGRAMFISTDEVIEFARAIEAAHGITGGQHGR